MQNKEIEINCDLNITSLLEERLRFDLTTVSKKEIDFFLNKGRITISQGKKRVSFETSVLSFFSGTFGGINYLIKNSNDLLAQMVVSDLENSFRFEIISKKNNIISMSSMIDDKGYDCGKPVFEFEVEALVFLTILKKKVLEVMEIILYNCPEYLQNDFFMKSYNTYKNYT